ncbi:MAG: site-specific DNA-methyltransferase [Lachnospiraceae bacterium]|nr:site-specific DNA-methyltransferase [Lachnospiraceae bacterium]
MSNKLDGMSMNIEQTEMEKLKAVFPQCFAEGKLDIDKLLSLCGEYIDNDFEKYKFEWKGKIESLKLAQKRSTGTLRPCKAESVNFDETKNLYIEGDNLEVLKLLQTAYYNKIKMIYIDPPYNTGSDFVYEDDFADPMARYKEVTQQTTKSNAETMGRYHTNWLNMMYPRLRLAVNLLSNDGVIFISIDDNEVTNLKKICNEVFGEENFVAQICIKGSGGRQDSKHFAVIHQYVICYAKNIDNFIAGEDEKEEEKFPYFDEEKGLHYKTQLLRKWGDKSKREDRPNLYYPITDPDGNEHYPMLNETTEGRWRWGKEKMAEGIEQGLVTFSKVNGKWVAYEKIYEGQRNTKKFNTWIESIGTESSINIIKELFGEKVFDYPKPVELIKQLIKMANTTSESIILDFFSGSATTAHATMQLNQEDGLDRKFIMVQLPEMCDEKSEASKYGYSNICEIGKERIRRAGKKILEETAQSVLGDEEKSSLDVGFKVFKLDTSNLKTWDGTPIQDKQIDLFYERLNAMIDTVKDDRTDMDVVYEVMLKMGIPLDVEVQYMEINDKIAYIVGDFILMICLADKITAEDIEAMAQYAPAKIICAEAGFADDSALSNAHYILKDRAIELKLV